MNTATGANKAKTLAAQRFPMPLRAGSCAYRRSVEAVGHIGQRGQVEKRPSSMQEETSLRNAINDLVMKYLHHRLETGDAIDIAEMAHEMIQNLIDMIMEQETDHQAPLLAAAIVSLGDEFLQRGGFLQSEGRDIH